MSETTGNNLAAGTPLSGAASQRPTYDVLSPDSRQVAHVMALLWTWSPWKAVYGLLHELGMNSASGRAYTQDQVRTAQARLHGVGWVVERDGRPGYFRLSDPFRAHMYAEVLERHAPADLRRALHRHLGMALGQYSFHWPLYETGTSAAVFRLELFVGADHSLRRMQEQITQRLNWNAVYSEACFEGFDSDLIERIAPNWRWTIVLDATYSAGVLWNKDCLSIAEWAMAQADVRFGDVPRELIYQLAQWQL